MWNFCVSVLSLLKQVRKMFSRVINWARACARALPSYIQVDSSRFHPWAMTLHCSWCIYCCRRCRAFFVARKNKCMYVDHWNKEKDRAHAHTYIHQYQVNQLKLVKINLKSRIFRVHMIPKSVYMEMLCMNQAESRTLYDGMKNGDNNATTMPRMRENYKVCLFADFRLFICSCENHIRVWCSKVSHTMTSHYSTQYNTPTIQGYNSVSRC